MIDGITVHFLDNFGIAADDIHNSFTPGFTPVRTELRGTSRSAPSLNPLSSVAPENTYFVGTDVHGRRFYSRNGDFHLVNGMLRTPNGSSVMGYASGSSKLSPLKVNPTDLALGRVTNAQVGADGSLTYERSLRDARSGVKMTDKVVVGYLAIARFPAGTELEHFNETDVNGIGANRDTTKYDGVHLSPPTGAEPTIGKPNSIGFGPLKTHSVDRGSLDQLAAMRRLSDVYLAYNTLKAIGGAKGKNEDKVIALLK